MNMKVSHLRFRSGAFQKGSFLSNLLTLMSGTTLAQALVIVTIPVLTRLYTPQDFGNFSLFVAVSTTVAVIIGWRYEMAIMLPSEEKGAANILVLTLSITIAMSALSFLIILFWRHNIAQLLKTDEINSWLWFIPISLLLSGFIQTLNYWGTRKQNYSNLAISRVGQSISDVSSKIGAGLLIPGLGGIGLIAGYLIGLGTGAAILAGRIFKADFKNINRYFSKKEMVRQGRLYSRFPLLDSWAGLANLGAHQLPPVLLTYFFDLHTAGFYFLGYKALNWPLTFIGGSITQIFYQRYEEKRKSGGKEDFLWRIIKYLTLCAIFPTIVLYLVAPFLFKVIFGPQWITAGEYVRYLIPFIFFRFIVSPVSTVLYSEGKNTSLTLWQLIFLLTSIGSFYIGGLFHNEFMALLIYSLTSSILYLILLGLIVSYSRKID